MYCFTVSLTSALEGMGGQHHTPSALPLGETWYLLYRRLGGADDGSGCVWKTFPHWDAIPQSRSLSKSL